MRSKCVFWTNCEKSVSGGSVSSNTLDPTVAETDALAFEAALANRKKAPLTDTYPKGAGNEVFEFWKYGKLIGTIRKRYVKEDRQRFIDTIEQFTPTYKGMIKRKGELGHEMSERNMQLCINCCAFALDTTMPEMQEDRVALYIKMHLEMILGPTWHVVVGRNFGFSVTVQARHFVVIRMLRLYLVLTSGSPYLRLLAPTQIMTDFRCKLAILLSSGCGTLR
jgi:dynein light chain LC8-type